MALLFQRALDEMNEKGLVCLEPRSFQKYLTPGPGEARVSTASVISVQGYESLPMDLKAAQVMVLRLGRSGFADSTTKFGLVRAAHSVLDEFFVIDAEVFPRTAREYSAEAPERLLPFRLLGKLVEASALDLAVVSGALGYALGLDPVAEPLIPARGAGAYTFDVRPRSDLDVTWRHDRGQVEIDGLIVARRNDRPCLFVIEAKWGDGKGTLAKHKLVYPCLALRALGAAPGHQIVPIYVRTWQDPTAVYFKIAELTLGSTGAVTSLTCRDAAFLRMPFQLLPGIAQP